MNILYRFEILMYIENKIKEEKYMLRNIKIFQNKEILSKIKEWDESIFLITIAKFVISHLHKEFHIFENDERYKNIVIYFAFYSKKDVADKKDDRGWHFCVKNDCHIEINVESVIEMSKNGLDFKNNFDALIHTSLHEFAHALDTIHTFMNSSLKSLEEQHDVINEEIGKKKEKLKQENTDPDLKDWYIHNNTEEEIDADYFAFQYLNVFKTIYISNSY